MRRVVPIVSLLMASWLAACVDADDAPAEARARAALAPPPAQSGERSPVQPTVLLASGEVVPPAAPIYLHDVRWSVDESRGVVVIVDAQTGATAELPLAAIVQEDVR